MTNMFIGLLRTVTLASLLLLFACSRDSSPPSQSADNGPGGGATTAPHCDITSEEGSECINVTFESTIAQMSKQYRWAMIVDLAVAPEYFEKPAKEYVCAGKGATSTMQIVPFESFKPVQALSGRTSPDHAFIVGDCRTGSKSCWTGPWGAVNLSAGRYLAFLSYSCCLEQMSPGSARLVFAFPVIDGRVVDVEGHGLNIEDVATIVTSNEGAPKYSIDGIEYFEQDTPCPVAPPIPRGPSGEGPGA